MADKYSSPNLAQVLGCAKASVGLVPTLLLDWTYQQMPAAAASAPALMSATYTVKEAGYAYMYVSNENPTLADVYYACLPKLQRRQDDVKMSYTASNVLQSSEYYPYGLQTANSWTRDNTTNNFLANGGTELNATSSLYDLDYRNYDPILGRMNGVDPMADKYSSHSPYNFAFNDPVAFNDPSGADPLPGEPDFVFRRRPETYGAYFAGNKNANGINGGWTGGGITSYTHG